MGLDGRDTLLLTRPPISLHHILLLNWLASE